MTDGRAVEGQAITAHVADPNGDPDWAIYTFWADGQIVQKGRSATYTPGYEAAGQVVTVRAWYEDGDGHTGTVRASAGAVSDSDRPGTITLAGLSGGNAVEGQAITASIADPDGLPASGIIYTFKSGSTVLQTGNASTYTPAFNLGGRALTVEVSYTDGQDHATTLVQAAGNVVDVDRAGAITLAGLTSGNTVEGQALTASVTDPDGVLATGITYTFRAGTTVLQSGTSSTYTPGYDLGGQAITVEAAYADSQGHSAVLTASGGIAQDVDRPGSLTLAGLSSGNAVEGQAITASLADADGVPAGAIFTFRAGTSVLQTGTASSFTPGFDLAGQIITVEAAYTDGQGHSEALSQTGGVVQDVNRPATLTLSGLSGGAALEEQTITATVADADGLPGGAGAITYTFRADGAVLQSGASNAFTPGFNAVGRLVTVEASFVDGQGHSEGPTAAAGVVQDAPPPLSMIFNYAFAEANLSFVDQRNIITGPDGVPHDVTGVNTLSFSDGSIQVRDGQPLVDDLYYYAKNLDVWQARIDPDLHYAAFGWREGRDPSALFSTNGYLAANPDVKAAGINPLQHYDQFGWREGRDPSALFDNEQYLTGNPDVRAAGLDPLAHYLEFGQAERRSIDAAVGRAGDIGADRGFDAEYYLLANADVARAATAAGGSSYAFARAHFDAFGWKEGRDPSAVFDTKGYLSAYADVKAAGINPLAHYDAFGWKEGRDPSTGYDTSSYLAAYADVRAAGVDPMLHYLQFGILEGRLSFADGSFSAGSVG
ncbi:hypothetical protein [Methylobacterium oxalidis]|uniref:hypothetical protein n=1 Tax=Methylobacterium oxalidis TaxID=944322 RepID=UPI0011BDAEE0|nr:hypothetical protein [Methylobacterium oxalidis]